jgi:hypothetical protein
MNGQSRGRRAKWIRTGLAVAVVIGAHVLNGGQADAATIDARPFGTASIAAAHDASAAPATPGIVVAGLTSQQYPVFFKISANARTLTFGSIAISMNCTSGDQFVVEDAFARVSIKANGRLHATFSQPPTAASGGVTYSGTDSLTAHLGRRHSQLSGTWRLQVNYSFTNGMSDECDSGPVRFTATG